jgi:type VI secretion system protein ImpC
MHLLILGDFAGDRRDTPLAERPLRRIDIDNFDAAMSRLAPRLTLALDGGGEAVIEPNCLDDLHPDALYRDLPLFAALRETRARLADPATFADAAAELGKAPVDTPATPSTGTSGEATSDTLERLLGKRPNTATETQAATGVAGFIRNIVTPFVTPDNLARQEAVLAGYDQAVAEQMRRILHHPRFQKLEATWRSLWSLISNLESDDERLQVHILDAGRDELRADLGAALGHALTRAAAGDHGWSMIVADMSFSTAAEDLQLLASLATLAAHAGGPLLAAAAPDLLGVASLHKTPEPAQWTALPDTAQQNWHALRTSAIAPWIGLALPRILLRLPYGRDTDGIDAFAFEEVGAGHAHEHFLWGNPAYVCARLLAEDFLEAGWSMTPGTHLGIGDLPAYSLQQESETVLLPCAEINLSDRAAEAILARGLIVLQSGRHRNAVRLPRLQSIADPACGLSGAWA